MSASLDLPVDTSDLAESAVDSAIDLATDLATDIAMPAMKAGLARFVLQRRRSLIAIVVLAMAAPFVVRAIRSRGNKSAGPSVPSKSEQTVSDTPTVEPRTPSGT